MAVIMIVIILRFNNCCTLMKICRFTCVVVCVGWFTRLSLFVYFYIIIYFCLRLYIMTEMTECLICIV
jgi:hypothetical protein